MDDLYRQIILDRYRSPQYRGELEHAQNLEEANPLCGDVVKFFIQTDENSKISQASWTGDGCALSLVSADMLAEKVLGMKLEEVARLTKDDILTMMGIDPGPARLKCVLLSLVCLQKLITQYTTGG
jgi:nitrogen fixation NifU-like protein